MIIYVTSSVMAWSVYGKAIKQTYRIGRDENVSKLERQAHKLTWERIGLRIVAAIRRYPWIIIKLIVLTNGALCMEHWALAACIYFLAPLFYGPLGHMLHSDGILGVGMTYGHQWV
jgi:hypothetical protein